MKYSRYAILAFVASLSFTTTPVSAVPVVVDGKEWRQVTDTINFSRNQFDIIFDRTTGLCDVASCLLGGTLDLTGYNWASNNEVQSLLTSFGFTTNPTLVIPGTSRTSQSQSSMDAFFNEFSETLLNSNIRRINGITRDQTNGQLESR